jgi:hypothetical protein
MTVKRDGWYVIDESARVAAGAETEAGGPTAAFELVLVDLEKCPNSQSGRKTR